MGEIRPPRTRAIPASRASLISASTASTRSATASRRAHDTFRHFTAARHAHLTMKDDAMPARMYDRAHARRVAATNAPYRRQMGSIYFHYDEIFTAILYIGPLPNFSFSVRRERSRHLLTTDTTFSGHVISCKKWTATGYTRPLYRLQRVHHVRR